MCPSEQDWERLDQAVSDLEWAERRARAALQGAEAALRHLPRWRVISRAKIRWVLWRSRGVVSDPNDTTPVGS